MYPGKVVESRAPEPFFRLLQNWSPVSRTHQAAIWSKHTPFTQCFSYSYPLIKNGYSCIARCLQNRVNSSLNQLGKALNIGSKPCGEKVYPGCTSIHCIGEGRPIVLEGIRGSWLKSIFDDQLRLPAVETTIAWKCPNGPFCLSLVIWVVLNLLVVWITLTPKW